MKDILMHVVPITEYTVVAGLVIAALLWLGYQARVVTKQVTDRTADME